MTNRGTPPLLALQRSPVVRQRIRVALHSGDAFRLIGPVIFATSWRDLGELAARHPGSPALVDPFLEDREDPSARPTGSVQLRPFSETPLICYARMDGVRHRRLDEMDIPFVAHLQGGIDDDLGEIHTAILQSIDVHRAHLLLRRINQEAPRNCQGIIAQVLTRAIGPITVPETATELGISQRTLFRRCAGLRASSPKTLISLARIFTVERLAEWSGRPSGTVALALGFSDRANYRRLVRRRLGAPSSAIRKRGGASHVAKVIVQSMRRRTPIPPVDTSRLSQKHQPSSSV